jgi:hypothetical protein
MAFGHNNASNPLRSIMYKSFLDAPAGLLTPCSHFFTVEGLMLKTLASAA